MSGRSEVVISKSPKTARRSSRSVAARVWWAIGELAAEGAGGCQPRRDVTSRRRRATTARGELSSPRRPAGVSTTCRTAGAFAGAGSKRPTWGSSGRPCTRSV